jgi:hypothetical protein
MEFTVFFSVTKRRFLATCLLFYGTNRIQICFKTLKIEAKSSNKTLGLNYRTLNRIKVGF